MSFYKACNILLEELNLSKQEILDGEDNFFTALIEILTSTKAYTQSHSVYRMVVEQFRDHMPYYYIFFKAVEDYSLRRVSMEFITPTFSSENAEDRESYKKFYELVGLLPYKLGISDRIPSKEYVSNLPYYIYELKDIMTPELKNRLKEILRFFYERALDIVSKSESKIKELQEYRYRKLFISQDTDETFGELMDEL